MTDTAAIKIDCSAAGGASKEASICERTACGLCELTYDQDFTILYANEYFYKLFGQARVQGRGNTLRDLLDEREYEKARSTLISGIETSQAVIDLEILHRRSEDRFDWLLFKCSYEYASNSLACAVLEVTSQKQREENLRVRAEMDHFAVLHEQIMTLRYHIPSRTLHVPTDIATLYGLPLVCPDWPDVSGRYTLTREACRSAPARGACVTGCQQGYDFLVSGQKEYLQFYQDMIDGKPSGTIVLQLHDRQNVVHCYRAEYTLIYDIHEKPLYGMISCKNIDDTWKLQADIRSLEEQSRLDGLTGLLNRTAAVHQINQLFEEAKDQSHALVMVDIDSFKQLNDTLGHSYGDQALQEFAALLSSHVRKDDIVGRLGGDEFILCLKNVKSVNALQKRLELLRLQPPKTFCNVVQITCCFGVALFPQDGLTFEDLYPKADAALYKAKSQGKDRYILYALEDI